MGGETNIRGRTALICRYFQNVIISILFIANNLQNIIKFTDNEMKILNEIYLFSCVSLKVLMECIP